MNQLRYLYLYGSIGEQETITMMFSGILQILAPDKSSAACLPKHNILGPDGFNHQFMEINIYMGHQAMLLSFNKHTRSLD